MLWYLASTYTSHEGGPHNAYVEACKIAGFLMNRGFLVYSPIAHCHGVSCYGNVNHFAHAFWMRQDKPLVDACDAIVVARTSGWQKSEGIAQEIEWFKEAGKPIIYISPDYIEDYVREMELVEDTKLLTEVIGLPPEKAFARVHKWACEDSGVECFGFEGRV